MKTDPHQRINITLPDQTLKKIDRVAKQGGRSRFIDVAVNFYLVHQKQAHLRNELQEGAIARASRDRDVTAEFFEIADSWETN